MIAAPIYIPTDSVRGFLFLHSFVNCFLFDNEWLHPLRMRDGRQNSKGGEEDLPWEGKDCLEKNAVKIKN